MKISIDEEVCKTNNMSFSEVLAILLVKCGENIPALIEDMVKREILVRQGVFNELYITQRWNDVVSNILLDSEDTKQPEERVIELAKAMMELFPRAKKEGTSQYFRGNAKDISLKLKKFFKLYGSKWTDEEILAATKRYVDSFNGNYQYMRVLKYFIWKDTVKKDSEGNGYVEETSDLATLLENPDSPVQDNLWYLQLR